MIVLGISDSHEAHACILRDGELIAVMAEERLSRLKADMGYPRRSIDAVLSIANIDPGEIDVVAVASITINMFQVLYKMNANLSVQDWVEQCHKYWKPVLLEGKKLTPFDDYDLFKDKYASKADDPYHEFIDLAREASPEKWPEITNNIRTRTICAHLGIPAEKVEYFRHEDCHKAYGFHSSPFDDETALIFTAEGNGDDSSATVSTGNSTMFQEHWRSNEVQLGRLYRYVTLLLGMKPMQHEYKVMGLAPYGTEYHGRRSLEFFRTINKVVGTEIHNTATVPDLYFSVQDALEGERFDGIAWGVQNWLEEMLCGWVANNCRERGISNVIFSGGVAQNIKACKTVAELAEVDQLWVGPISGDGSLGVGSAWLAHRKYAPEMPILGLPHVYLGSEWGGKAIDQAIERHGLQSRFKIIERPSPAVAAQWLAEGQILARFSGLMEFGQRALGNRSILADPRSHDSVERINNKIKYRDFWMPFTPSMLIEDAEVMLQNPKDIYSPFMTLAFDLKPEYQKSIPAAVHPADKTARPQMLKQNANPGYYELISEFKQLTGIGCVLNTSLNLHGDAIVESPDDAIHTFLKSELDTLLFDDVAISRVD